MIQRHIAVIFAVLGTIVVSAGGAARAETLEWHAMLNAASGWDSKGPVYDPASKSYFALARWRGSGNVTWKNAKAFAEGQAFKGVQGRLAIIRSYDTHLFLLTTFRVNDPTWIGMNVECKPIRAFWLDGKPADQDEFNAWEMGRWYRTDINCMNGVPWMGVYYTSTKDLFRWQAAGPAKSFHLMFIEYPTGQP